MRRVLPHVRLHFLEGVREEGDHLEPDGGPFFGVPYHNWFGWFFVGFVAMLTHGYIFRKEEPRLLVLEEQPKWVRLMSGFPLVVTAFCELGLMLINYEGILGLTQLYMLLIPMIAAVWQFVKWMKKA